MSSFAGMATAQGARESRQAREAVAHGDQTPDAYVASMAILLAGPAANTYDTFPSLTTIAC